MKDETNNRAWVFISSESRQKRVEEKKVDRVGHVPTVIGASPSKVLASDEEFYEVFSEIRLP